MSRPVVFVWDDASLHLSTFLSKQRPNFVQKDWEHWAQIQRRLAWHKEIFLIILEKERKRIKLESCFAHWITFGSWLELESDWRKDIKSDGINIEPEGVWMPLNLLSYVMCANLGLSWDLIEWNFMGALTWLYVRLLFLLMLKEAERGRGRSSGDT